MRSSVGGFEQCTEHMLKHKSRAMHRVHPRTDGTDVTENLVQVDRSSLDLIARREIQSDSSSGFDPNQHADSAL